MFRPDVSISGLPCEQHAQSSQPGAQLPSASSSGHVCSHSSEAVK